MRSSERRARPRASALLVTLFVLAGGCRANTTDDTSGTDGAANADAATDDDTSRTVPPRPLDDRSNGPGSGRGEGSGPPGQVPLPTTLDEALRSANHVGSFTVLGGPFEEELAFGPAFDEAHVWPVYLVHRYAVEADEAGIDLTWNHVAPAWAPTDQASTGLTTTRGVTEVLIIGGVTQYIDDLGAPLTWDDPVEAAAHSALGGIHARPPAEPILAPGRRVVLFLHHLSDVFTKWYVPQALRWRVDGAFELEGSTLRAGSESVSMDELAARAFPAFEDQWARMLESWRAVDTSSWVSPPRFAAELPPADRDYEAPTD